MDNIDKILTHVRTKDEARELLTQIEAFAATMYSLKESSFQDYFSHLPKSIADAIEDLMKPLISHHGTVGIQNIIQQLQDKIHSCRTLQLTLAFEPDDTTITIFSTWAKEHIGTDVVLDLQVNRTLVGGAIIVSNGQYRDYSVKKKLSQVFQIQREDILGSLSQG